MKQSRLFTILAVLTLLAVTGGTALTSGKIYIQNEQYPEAVAALKEALLEEPDNWDVHFNIGVAYSHLDSVALAYSHFVKAKELNAKKATQNADNNIQSNYARHYKLGQAAFSRQDFVTAASEFGIASLADPRQSASHFNRAVAFSRIAEKDSTYAARTLSEAELALELSDPTDPNYSKALTLVGRQLVALGREDEVPARFQPLVEESPSNYPVLEEIGMDALTRKKWKGASIFLTLTAEARTAAGEESFDTYYNAGVALFNLGREETADPAAAEAGNAHLVESVAYYEKALGIKPDDGQTVLNLVATNMVLQDWSNASLWGEKYVNENPADARGWQFLVKIYTELGDTDKATDARQRYEQLRTQ